MGLMYLAGLVCLLAGILTRLLSIPGAKLAYLDCPNERSLHVTPTPRTGGLAIFGSVGMGVLLSLWLDWLSMTSVHLSLLGATLLVLLVSFWDDRANLSPGVRFGIQALAAGVVVWGAQVKLITLTVPWLGSVSLGSFAVPVTILCVMWMANLYNFMDGMDGFAGGMTVVGYGFLAAMAWGSGQQFLMIIPLLIAAATGGFLLYNAPPARIFMGDVGSVPLGFLAAALAVLGAQHNVFDIWSPLILFSPFIVDATATLLRRLLRGEKIWQAHREHYYQRLVLAGWGHRKTVVAEYVLMLVCGAAAVSYGALGEGQRLTVLMGGSAMYLILRQGVCIVEKHAASVPEKIPSTHTCP